MSPSSLRDEEVLLRMYFEPEVVKKSILSKQDLERGWSVNRHDYTQYWQLSNQCNRQMKRSPNERMSSVVAIIEDVKAIRAFQVPNKSRLFAFDDATTWDFKTNDPANIAHAIVSGPSVSRNELSAIRVFLEQKILEKVPFEDMRARYPDRRGAIQKFIRLLQTAFYKVGAIPKVFTK